MKETLNGVELQFFEGIEAILGDHWNRNFPPDACRRCAQDVFRLALANASTVAVARHLRDTAVEQKAAELPLADHVVVAASIRELKLQLMRASRWAS